MYEAEQHADLQIRRYQKIKDDCRKAREKMEGVSTLSIQKKSYSIEAMNAVAKRNANIKKTCC